MSVCKEGKIMNIKKILVLLIFAVAVASIIAPANAKINGDIVFDSNKDINGKSKLSIVIDSDIGLKDNFYERFSAKNNASRIKELNKVNKVVVKIKGYNPITFKKPKKNWTCLFNTYFAKEFELKGKPKKIENKSYSIKLYDKNNKLLKSKTSKLHIHDDKCKH